MAATYTRVGVIGAGVMGRGIAQVFAQAGARVALVDQSIAALEAAVSGIGETLDRAVSKDRISGQDAKETLARITPSQRLSSLAGQDLVIEAIVEDVTAKSEVLSEVAALAPLAVLASNTSSLANFRHFLGYFCRKPGDRYALFQPPASHEVG